MTGAYNEFWQWDDKMQLGDHWLRIAEHYFTDSSQNYTVGNLYVRGIQYRFGQPGAYDPENRSWTTAEGRLLWEPLWIINFDLANADILSLQAQETDDGTTVTITFDGDPRQKYGVEMENCVQTYYLDRENRLLRLVETSTRRETIDGQEYLYEVVSDIYNLPVSYEEAAQVIQTAKAEAK